MTQSFDVFFDLRLFSAANLALAGFPLTKTLGENLPSGL